MCVLINNHVLLSPSEYILLFYCNFRIFYVDDYFKIPTELKTLEICYTIYGLLHLNDNYYYNRIQLQQ